MVPHYGKREVGGLTAVSPGDTLYFPFGSYNDSGDSEILAGLAVTDIELFKNGDPTARATDSGYSLISDTGMLGNRVGLYRFSVQLYNTADDTGFFDVGSHYLVAVDAVTIDAKTVRFYVGQFETGRQRVDVRAVLGDTGAAHLDQGRFGVISDSGRQAAVLDTGKVSNAVWDTLRANHVAAGSYGRDLADSGMVAAVMDTGKAAAAIWTSHATRTLTAFALDTGIRDTVWRASPSSYTSDTGSFGYAQGRVMAVRNDTGAAHLDQGRFGVISDSGRQAAVLDTGKVAAAIWASHATRTLTAFGFDTGVSDTVWKASQSAFSDTGSFAYAQGRLMKVNGDTGAAHLDQGRLGVISDSGRQAAVLDTGKVAAAIWTSHATRALTAFGFDTGIAQTVWRESQSSYSDTGAFAHAQGRLMKVLGDTGAAHLDQGRLGVIADSGHIQGSIDTGKVSNAVWDTLRANHTAAGSFGRDLADSGMVAGVIDTGKTSNAVWDTLRTNHTGAGSFGRDLLDSGMAATVLDTGKVSVAVWSSQNSTFTDTGSFGFGVNVHKMSGDTGAAQHLADYFALQQTPADTGLIVTRLDAIKLQTDKIQFDTGANEIHVDIRKVNNVQVQGAGDTGTGNTWRPV